ncbi:MAG: TonB-dependent copper receptor, partial [Dokdonella sp.]
MSILNKLALAAVVCAPLTAWAASNTVEAPGEGEASGGSPLSFVRFSPIVVTAASPVSALTFEIDPKAPRQPVPASDGADYLKTIPGFTAIRNGGSNGDPVLRGMFGSRINILANDGAMQGACPARMDNTLSYVAPETYDRLIVIKGPQSVLWGPGASAGTVRFERETAYFDSPGWRLEGSALAGSWGRNDQVVDAAGGSPLGYARLTANRSESDDYKDGDGNTVPSSWDKWNADAAIGWTPDADTRLELTVGGGDGEARYAGRGMDGTQFKRESIGLKFAKNNIGGVLDAVEANVYSNYADHVMDNYTLRAPDPHGAMPMPMASNVDRRTSGGRVAGTWVWSQFSLTGGLDHQRNRHRARSGMGAMSYRVQPWLADAEFSNTGLFAEGSWKFAEQQRLIAGARMDRAAVEDLRRSTGGMMPMPNPSAGVTRHENLPGGFVRYEHDLAASPTSFYVGAGHVERMPDYWELFSPSNGPMGSPNAFLAIAPEKTTQLDIGAQYSGEAVRAWVSLYAGRVDDFILFRYQTADMGGGHGGMMGDDHADDHGHSMGPTSQALNVNARTRGGELGGSWHFAPSWNAEASLAYAWGENRSDGRPLPQMPPLQARFAL